MSGEKGSRAFGLPMPNTCFVSFATPCLAGCWMLARRKVVNTRCSHRRSGPITCALFLPRWRHAHPFAGSWQSEQLPNKQQKNRLSHGETCKHPPQAYAFVLAPCPFFASSEHFAHNVLYVLSSHKHKTSVHLTPVPSLAVPLLPPA